MSSGSLLQPTPPRVAAAVGAAEWQWSRGSVYVTDARDRSVAAYMAPDARRHQRAQRDLRDVVSSGTLQPVGRTRARFYVAGLRFPNHALKLAHTPMTLVDPYAA